MTRPPPRSTLFPYTTLFRSDGDRAAAFQQLAFEGLSVTAIAKRTGTKQAVVKNGLAVAENAVAVSAIQEHQLTLDQARSEEHTSELQSQFHLVCRLLLEKKK